MWEKGTDWPEMVEEVDDEDGYPIMRSKPYITAKGDRCMIQCFWMKEGDTWGYWRHPYLRDSFYPDYYTELPYEKT